jgi:transcriptional regulator with XRE-family HTH domain
MAANSKAFGERLGQLILQNGLNIKKLSEKIDVAYSAVWGYVKKGSIPEAPVLYRLSRELGISMEELLTGGREGKKKAAGQMRKNSISRPPCWPAILRPDRVGSSRKMKSSPMSGCIPPSCRDASITT